MKLEHLDPTLLNVRSDAPRVRSVSQDKALQKSIKAFGFRQPVLVDADRKIVAGHARVSAATALQLATIPVIRIEDLNEPQIRAYMIADNRIGEMSDWDFELLSEHFSFFLDAELDFEMEAIGFDYGFMETLVQNEGDQTQEDDEHDFKGLTVKPRAKPGDVWQLGPNRVICGDARSEAAWHRLMDGAKAQVAFTDPPYNLPARTITQSADRTHGAFAMGSGEMSSEAFSGFLSGVFVQIKAHFGPGATAFVCMDWRHMGELLAAGDKCFQG